MAIRRIRRALREGRFEYTVHALDEMDEDNLTDGDVRSTIRTGRVAETLTDDPRSERFVVRGQPRGHEVDVEVVCRFLPSGNMRIITVYRAED